MFGMQTDSDLKIILGVLVFLLAVMAIVLVWHFIRIRMRGRPEGTMSLTELKGLEGKLTKEELNAVRHAMARQYLQNQASDAPRGVDGAPLKPLEALAAEAQRAEIELAKRAAGTSSPPAATQPPPRPALLPVPPPSAEPPPEVEACTVGSRPKIADHLKPLLAKPLQEVEDMRNAGFLSEEEFALVVRERERAACPRCSG